MNFKTGALLFFTLLNISFGLLVYSKNRRSPNNISYAIFMSLVGLWSFGLAMFYFGPAQPYSIFWSNFLYIMGSSIAVSFFLVSLTLPTEKPVKKQTIIWPLISLFILFVLYFFTPLMIIDISYPRGVKTFVYGQAHLLFDIHFSIFFLWAIIRLFRALKTTIGQRREQIKYVLLSTFIGVTFNGLTNVTMPSIFHDCSLIWIGPYITFVMVSIMTYAIARYKIYDIHFVIRGSVVNIVIAIVLTSIFLSLLLIHGGILKSILIFIMMLLTAIYLPKIKLKTLDTVNYILYKDKYQYQDKLETFIDNMPFIPGEKDLFRNTIKTTTETLGVRKVAIFTFDTVSDDYRLRDQLGLEDIGEFSIPVDNGIVSWLRKYREVFVKEEMEKVLNKDELLPIRQTIDKLDATICVPALLETDLLGFITLGEKSSGEMYSHIDTGILHRLGTQFAVALDYKRIEAELRKKQEYAAIGQLAFEITHEMKNLLVPIRTFLDLVPDKINDPGFMNDFRKIAITHASVINRKVEDILYFGKNQVLNLEKDIDLNQILKDTVTALSPMANKKNAPIEEQYDTLPRITGDSGLLVHVFNNLVINAIDAMEGKTGKIRIRTMINPNPTGQMQQLSQRWIRIEVKDDGIGIPPELKERIFDAFVTTKHFGETLQTRGVGLGLTVVKKILDLHHGIIGVNSTIGKGSTFAVDLPVDLKKE